MMDEKVMYVWTVFSYEPYEWPETEFVCARKEVAEYLRDWLEAIEENRCFDLAIKYNKQGFQWSGNKEIYEIKENEVIL